MDKAFGSKALGDRLNLQGLTYIVDLQKEWNQIFNDAWRWYRDFFYDANFHGRDWKAMGDKYRAYIPQLSSRDELNWVLSQMVGELCVSHTYIGGGDLGPLTAPSSPVFTGLLGADLVPDAKAGFYRFEKIYGPTEINLGLPGPLSRPDISLKEGDYLIALNGVTVTAGDDYFKLLQTTAGRKIKITVNARPVMEGAKTYEVEPIRSDSTLRYNRWLADNIKTIEKATGGKVGYMHINAMGSGGIGEFDKYWRAFRYNEGIIIDVRRNGGGWTEYFIIDKLERELTAYNNLRNMVPFRYPGLGRQRQLRRHLQREQRLGRRGVRRALQGPQARPRHRRAVVGRPGRDPQRPDDDRQRHGRAVEQRLLRARRQVDRREPRGRPGHPRGQRPGIGPGRPRPPAREGDRSHAERIALQGRGGPWGGGGFWGVGGGPAGTPGGRGKEGGARGGARRPARRWSGAISTPASRGRPGPRGSRRSRRPSSRSPKSRSSTKGGTASWPRMSKRAKSS